MELKISNRTIFRVVAITIGCVVAVNLIVRLQTQIVWILTALFFALALEPAVDLLSKFLPRKSRGLAVLVVFLGFLAVIVFISLALVPPFASQLYHLAINLPGAYSSFAKSNPSEGRFISSHLSASSVASALQQFSKQLLSFGGSAVVIARGFFGGVVAVVTVLLLTFFMVLEGPHWMHALWQLTAPKQRDKYKDLLQQMHGTVTGYVGGNLFTSMIAALSSAIMLIILRSPYAFALGLLVGVVDLIPMVGATLAAILVCVIVLVFKGLTTALILAVFYIIYQQVENNVLQPIVFSKAVEVSPLITLMALILGASLAGLIGALVAIPVAASLQLLARFYFANVRGSRKTRA
jgi:predicted PurR-regulated permease PerM